MKLAFSNIAWDLAEEESVHAVLAESGISAIEVAPTKIWPDWKGVDASTISAAKIAFDQRGFQIPSMQAILFGCPDLKVFGDAQDLKALGEHVDLVAEIASGLGAKTLVFGSPRNRDPGDLSPPDAMDRAVEVFAELGAHCARHGVWLGIEANPEVYNCRFMTRWRESAELVRRCNSPGIRLHLDAACTHLANDDLAQAVRECEDILAHVHVSEPQLGPFDAPQADHRRFAATLREVGYRGWCSIEMRRTDTPVQSVREAAAFATEVYG